MNQQHSQLQNQHNYTLELSQQIKTGHAIAKWKKMASKSKNRYYRLRELVTTEGDYLNDLMIIRDHVKKPLREEELVSQNEERSMFANIESMIQLSSEMMKQLEIIFKQWNRHTTMIGAIMKKYAKFMLVYSDYFKNLSHTQNVIKNLLKINPKAQLIQSKLSTSEKIVTIQNLMSKPFQRPLKYHLILRDYASKVPHDHPDYATLQEAIECYHQVNEQNNIALQNKQKNQILIDLDNRFGDIIDKGARYYIGKFQSILIDVMVDLYLFSNLLLIAFKTNQRPIRIYLDRWSYTQRPADGHCFLNRVYVYGRKHCIHLSFLQKIQRNEFHDTIDRVIADIRINQINREQRIHSASLFDRWTRNTRNSMIERRYSFTQLNPQTRKPIIATIIGNDQRIYQQGKIINYFVIQFHTISARLDQTITPHQVVLISEQALHKIQQMTVALYKQFWFVPLNSTIKNKSKSDLQKNKEMRYELQTVFTQLFINSLLRNKTIAKRLDIYAHILGMSDVLWDDVLTPNKCTLRGCKVCLEETKYEDYEEYVRDIKGRLFAKNENMHGRIFPSAKIIKFCDRKTIHMRQALQKIPHMKMRQCSLELRLEWVKSRFGWINYVFTETRPRSVRMSAKVYFCNVTNPSQGMEVDFSISEKMRQIRQKIGSRLRVNLEDYGIMVVIGQEAHILEEDQSLGRIINHPKQEEGFFGSFFRKDPYKLTFVLRKVWFFETPLEINCQNQRKLHIKTQQFIYRIKHGQIKLRDLKNYSKVYAWYYCFKHFIELDTLTHYIIKKRTQELDKMLPSGMRSNIFDTLWEQIQRIKYNKQIQNQNQLAEKIVSLVLDNPSGSSYFYEAQLRPDNIKIKIGCDYQGIKVRDGSNLLFVFTFESKQLEMHVNGFQLTIIDDKPYTFYSRQMWQLKRQADMYIFYYDKFIQKRRALSCQEMLSNLFFKKR